MAPVLLELVKMMLGDGAVNVLGVAAVVCGFPGRCGRLELYHRSASGCVLNFLNLAPGNPWTCDWVSSLHKRAHTVQSLSQNTSCYAAIAGADTKRLRAKRDKAAQGTHQVVNTPISRPLHTA